MHYGVKMQLGDEMYNTGPMAKLVDETQSVTYHALTNPTIEETYKIVLPDDIITVFITDVH